MDPSEQRLNPFPWYQAMRTSRPIAYDPRGDIWSVFRYDDVERVLSDYAAFSSRFQGAESPHNPLSSSLISTDPPRHRHLRPLVTQAFTPRAIAQMEPRIAAVTDELLGHVAPDGKMDVVRDLAYPLPVIVIAELLGIPPENRDRFKKWSDLIVGSSGSQGEYGSYGEVMREVSEYFRRTIEIHRREPKDDLVTALLEAQIDEEHLSEQDMLGFCVLLLVAGNETTTNLIANSILCFDEHPEVMEELRADPELLPGAIEEVLRYRSPDQSMFRVVAAETELDGQHMRPGQRVLAWIGSANHDEAQFPAPEWFDIRRDPNRHIAFGHGIHYCLGAPLARLESRVALGAMPERMRDIKRVPGTKLQPLEGIIVYGVKSLPVTFKAPPLTRVA